MAYIPLKQQPKLAIYQKTPTWEFSNFYQWPGRWKNFYPTMLSSVQPASHTCLLFPLLGCLPLLLSLSGAGTTGTSYCRGSCRNCKTGQIERWLFQYQFSLPMTPVTGLATLSNFSVSFMYKRMCEWFGHTDVILFYKSSSSCYLYLFEIPAATLENMKVLRVTRDCHHLD